MAIERILFPTKFRELAYESLETLIPLKKAGLKEVVFCHVISREDVGFVPFGGYLKEEETKLREEAKIRFEDWQKSLSEKGINSRVMVNVGETVPEVLKAVESEDIDLLVIGRKKRAGSPNVFIGSNAHKIITRCKHPVLISKYMVQYEEDDASFTKINKSPFELPMIAADWSERSDRIIKLVTSLKEVINKVLVFYNIEDKILEKSTKSEIASLKQEVSHNLADYCSRLSAGGVEAESHIGAGGMLNEMLRVSRERKATSIIMGNTSKVRFLSNFLDRSLSYQLTKASELPTLLVP